ncbi:MAG: hypothetical protein CME06_04325 [Gemmatimonadetes bacterium]|nr:hypothetical protein [Gemmatimonadota bacterium]
MFLIAHRLTRSIALTATAIGCATVPALASGGFHLAALEGVLMEDDPSSIGGDPWGDDQTVYGGLGIDVIDGDTWVLVSLRPELSFGKLGVGLYVPLRFSTSDGEVRGEDWDSFSDYLSVFRYVRWAHKGDPFYVRVGVQDSATIGHGSIMRRYSNTLDEDERKTGFVLDLDRGPWGFESIYSNLTRGEIMGGRVYARPFFTRDDLPLLDSMAIGATLISDVDPNPFGPGDAAVVMGFDIDLPVVRRSTFDLTLYYDHVRIVDYGAGNILGVVDVLRFPANSLTLTTRLERRFLGDEIVVPYFDHFYELDRATRLEGLKGFESDSGWFGEAIANLLNTLYVVGSYEWKDGDPDGRLHAETVLPDLGPSLRLSLAYDRFHVDGFDDVVKLDEDSHLLAEAKYPLNSYLWLVGSFHRTWMLSEVVDGVPVYEPTDRSSVRVELAVPISFE